MVPPMQGGTCRNCVVAVFVAVLSTSSIGGQQGAVPDARSVRTLTFTATGRAFMLGQQPGASEPWPPVVVKSYTVALDYEHGGMRVEQVLTSAMAVPRGGSTAIDGERRELFYARDGYAWSESLGPDGMRIATPQPSAAAERAVWTWAAAPQGLAKVVTNRRPFAVDVDRAQRVISARTQIPNEVLGDMAVEIAYSDYKNFGPMVFPSHIVLREGGHATLDLSVISVVANEPVDITVPANVVAARDVTPRVEVSKLADGIYWILRDGYNSLAADMGDHVVVLEAGSDDAYSTAILAEIAALLPNKPVRYVVNTHLHFDHAGALRGFANAGATVVTHHDNVAVLDKAWRARRTLAPDLLSKSGMRWSFRGVADRLILRGATQRTIELHALRGNPHNEQMLIAWLPMDDILFQADLLGERNSLFNFADTMARLRIRPGRIVGSHGTRPSSMEVVDNAVRLQRAKLARQS